MSLTHSPPAELTPPGKASAAGQLSPLAALRSLPARVLLLWGGAAAAIGAMYWPTLMRLRAVWDIDPDYSHGYIVIPASLFFCYLAWERWQAQPERATVDSRQSIGGVIQGIIRIGLGLALHWGALLLNVLLVDVLSLILVLRGSVLLLGGAEMNRVFTFPALFLIFMAPLPAAVQNTVALIMQRLVAMFSTTVLELLGVTAYREGYMIYLPGWPMEVGAACSGLRSMMALLALGAAVGFVLNGSRWYRWSLVALALPIAALANVIRVVITGFILLNFGRKYAEGIYHDTEGAVLIGLAAAILVAAAVGLKRLDVRG